MDHLYRPFAQSSPGKTKRLINVENDALQL
jgi:hypothetical protein